MRIEDVEMNALESGLLNRFLLDPETNREQVCNVLLKLYQKILLK